QERLETTRRVTRAQPLVVQLGLENRPVPPGYSIEMEGAALAAAVDMLHPTGRVDLVAWSYGGFLTLDYALNHPQRVRSLTLIEPPAFWVLAAVGDPEYEEERDRLRPLAERLRDDVTEADLEEFVQFASLVPRDVAPQDMPQWPVWLEHRRSLRGQFDAEFGYRGDLVRLQTFDRPVLLVKGRGSTPILHRIVEVLANAMPAPRVVELDVGHAPRTVEIARCLLELERFHADPRWERAQHAPVQCRQAAERWRPSWRRPNKRLQGTCANHPSIRLAPRGRRPLKLHVMPPQARSLNYLAKIRT